MNESGRLLHGVRRAVWVMIAGVLFVQLLRHGLDPLALAIAAAIALLGWAFEMIERRTRRPRKTYLRLALAASATALVLIVMPALLHAALWIGVILWAGLVLAGLAWCIQYERTEPL